MRIRRSKLKKLRDPNTQARLQGRAVGSSAKAVVVGRKRPRHAQQPKPGEYGPPVGDNLPLVERPESDRKRLKRKDP